MGTCLCILRDRQLGGSASTAGGRRPGPECGHDAVCALGELNLSIVDSLESLHPLGQSLPLVQVAVLNVELFTDN